MIQGGASRRERIREKDKEKQGTVRRRVPGNNDDRDVVKSILRHQGREVRGDGTVS
jgi:hypothetical protein